MKSEEKEHRIRSLAYRIWQTGGDQNALNNWFLAEHIINIFPRYDFEIEGRCIYLRDLRYGTRSI